MAANEHDRAVVIGIRRYADVDAPERWITDLKGPDNDAAAVAEWLVRDDGGGLPPDHVTVINSASSPDPFPDKASAAPHQKAVQDAFRALIELPTTTHAGQYAGRRLYVYVSGHGWAVEDQDAAVITAEASLDKPFNVLVTDWVKWLWYAARFQEFVLWVDTCASRRSIAYLQACDVVREHRQDAAKARRFTAFAAGFGMQAVEANIEGEWHGVFTHALLQALRGAAGSPVTSDNLRDYLYNGLRPLMTEAQLADSRVAKEPAFGTTDDLVFATPAQPSRFSVTLEFQPEWVGKQVTIIVGQSAPLAVHTVPQQAQWQLELEAGVYVVFSPDLNRSHPFEVTGGESNGVIAVS